MFFVKLLKKFGFTYVDLAENGVEALEKIAQLTAANGSNYDAIFMDCMMPKMDGYEATSTIRKHEKQSAGDFHVPIIAMTANALAGDREACFAVGMDEYVSKPIQPDRVKNVLQQWFVFPSDTNVAVSAVSSTHSSPALDWARVQLIAETDEEKMDVIALFFRTSDELAERMKKSRRSQEFPEWKIATHSLKGSAANLGMPVLAELCLRGEHGEHLSYHERSDLLQEIRNELSRIRASIQSTNPLLLG